MKRRPDKFDILSPIKTVSIFCFGGQCPLLMSAINVELIVQFVYILRCNNGHPYTGCTDNLKERLERHFNGYVPATKNLRPVKLIWYGCFEDKYLAFNFEKYLKTCSGRVLMNKRLINGFIKLKAK